MIKALERIAADPYIRRIMEDQEIDEMELNLLKNTNTSLRSTVTQQGNTIVVLQANNADLQAQIAEYQRRFGILTPSPN